MTSPTPARVILLGIDAANPALLEQWAGDGTLPNLAALIARGTVAHTRGVEGFYVGSTWPSMYTATTPARHGVHYLLQLVPGTYRLHWVAEEKFVRKPPFWEALHDANKRVAVLDVPLTRLTTGFNGIQVVEWGGHDSLFGFQAWPPSVGDELRARHGVHPVGGSCDRAHRTRGDYAEFVRDLEAGVARKADWTESFLAKGGWDLFMQVFTESHCVGHQCWHLHDPSHPAHDAEFARMHGDPLRRVYRAIDDAIGRILAHAGDAQVIVFTAHGMSHRFGAQFLLKDILVRLGVTVPQREAPGDGHPGLLYRAARRAWRTVPTPLRRLAAPLRSADKAKSAERKVPSLRFDMTASQCFPINNGLAVGGIRLNIAGREPNGRLAPGAEVETFRERLSAQLLDVVDEATGRPLVRRVVQTRDLYEGEHLDSLPDLLVEWDDTTPIESTALGDPARGRLRARSGDIGAVEGVNDYGRTGEHRPNGWMVAAGPGIPVLRMSKPVSLLDIAPTAAALLGVRLPDVDGSPILEIIT